MGAAVLSRSEPFMKPVRNLFDAMPQADVSEETFTDLLAVPGLRVERIVSQGQISPPGFWYEQDWDEWVMIIEGEAHLQVEGQENPLRLKVGDHVWLPAGRRHRVVYTRQQPPTIWLAVHRGMSPGSD